MIGVEVELSNFVLAAAPNHRAAKPDCESSFVLDSRALSCEVSDHELTVAGLRHDLIRNFIIVFLPINPNRLEARF
jgi:hypothetical protein